MIYIALGLILFIIEYLYIRAAKKFNIFDYPNERSSHQVVTVRGGGILILFSVLFYSILSNNWNAMILGALIVGIFSFWNDIRPVRQIYRAGVQLLAVQLIFYETGFTYLNWYWVVAGFLLTVGWINAFNFMDGINGITVFYSSVSLAIFYWIPDLVEFQQFIKFVGLSVLIFGFFNVRKKAVTFLGDVGSITIAFILAYLMITLIVETYQWEYVLFFSIYGIDTVVTLVQRLIRKENIFSSHRSHLYQYLTNEKKWSHLFVSTLYALLQGIINLALIFFIIPHPHSAAISISLLIILGLTYTILKYQIIHSIQHPIKS
ncbi:MAG: UDP-GlcNAc--UDP-phosphate GlcNAc-1-phosphate transferase [Bacteroidetes bacterium]|nr:UDP-GlcNAc--UDP-phosphate GlcNAc-1-phosphate transferase [Bacteroidota bacterium]